MVATDSYRLSVKETTLEEPLEGGFEANVPARALRSSPASSRQTSADAIDIAVRVQPGRLPHSAA